MRPYVLPRIGQKVGSPAFLVKTCGSVIKIRRNECLNSISRSAPFTSAGHYHQREDSHLDRDHDSAPSELSPLSPARQSDTQPLCADGGRFTLARGGGALGTPYSSLLL